MRKRNVGILLRLDRKEADLLEQRVKRSGLSREAYLRHLIADRSPREAPSPDYFGMMRELHGIGNNLNQIAQKAHVLHVMDVQRYDTAVRQVESAIRRITEAVVLPQQVKAGDEQGGQ